MSLTNPPPFRLPNAAELNAIAAQYNRYRIAVGDTLGVFRVRDALAHQGAVSTVFLAESTVDLPAREIWRGKRYIIKGLPVKASTSTATNTRNLRSFFNEIRVLPHVSNATANNVVRLVDANGDPTRGKLYMVLEELAYKSVRDKYPDKKIDPDILLGFARCLTRALTHVHNLGIVHGDFKPDNFMIDVSGEAVLVDFGSSFFTGRRAGRTRIPPDPDDFREPFTPLYCSPELARYKLYGGATNPKDQASDAWSLGVSLWELAVGERPFSWMSGETLTKILEEIGRGVLPVRPEILTQLAKEAPRKSVEESYQFLQKVITRLLTVAPERRATCFDIHGEILGFLRQKGVDTQRKAIDRKTVGRLEMARKLAQLDDSMSPAGSSGKPRRRTSAAMELKNLELREEYIKGPSRKTALRAGGWASPAAPEQDDEEKKKKLSFEEFCRQRKPQPKREQLSFEEFAKRRRLDEIRSMKADVEDAGDTSIPADDTRSCEETSFNDMAETSMEAAHLPAFRGEGKADDDDEDLDATDTQVDLRGPIERYRKIKKDDDASEEA